MSRTTHPPPATPVRTVSPRERWAETLDALTEVASPSKRVAPGASPSAEEGDHRLVWVVSKRPFGIDLEPREQARTEGAWSKGRPVALQRLFEQRKQLGFLTPADLAVCASIETYTTYEHYGRYPR